jgi:hypothetical protein
MNDANRQAVLWNLGGKDGVEQQSWAWITEDGLAGWHVAAAADFNRDGTKDVVWVNDTNRQAIIWHLGGNAGSERQSWAWLAQEGLPGWDIAAASDFNQDGRPDVVWINEASRQAVVWYLGGNGGNERQSWGWLAQQGLPGWNLAAAGDFNQDKTPDVVWISEAGRQAVVWYLGGKGGNERQSWAWLTQEGLPGWRLSAAGDVNRDGALDVVWVNDANRQAISWFLSGKQGVERRSWAWLSREGLSGWSIRAIL